MTSASACGKAILLGEHAVVYGQPAIAIPLSNLRAFAEVEPGRAGTTIRIEARDLGQVIIYPDIGSGDLTTLAMQTTVRNVLNSVHCDFIPALKIVLHSQLPAARGLGSGTAISTALMRALALHLGYRLSPSTVSELVYRTEVIFHGQPSGIDNAVVSHERAVLFQRGQPLDMVQLSHPFKLVIADTGIAAQTRTAVAKVRQLWQANQARYETLFSRIGDIVVLGKAALVQGNWIDLGHYMDANQELLSELEVSCPELDRLIMAARKAGALGAKLSGGGMGGCMIALAESDQADAINSALTCAGAQNVWKVDVRDADRD
jgi:mevalonate kinase